ncbi:unnamed protein product, partial [Mesorhabditis belari]|uniref:Palmitoyltransferase n=1 Tax=Mesorhabditis belari TaxID=2138241 RepID=A0AAF3EED8_9BILA
MRRLNWDETIRGDRMNHSLSDSAMDPDVDMSKRIRRLIPEQIQDKVSMFLFLVILPLLFTAVFFLVLTTWYPAFGEAWMIRVIPIIALLFNMYLNYIQVIRVGPNGNDSLLPKTYRAGFVFCPHCRMNAPPRTHHCPVCNVCSLRRDHHCSFAATCIGHFNQRYFCAAILDLFMAALPAFYWTWSWMWLELGTPSVGRMWQLMMPHVALVLRFLSLREFCYVGLCAVMLTTTGFNLYLILAQAFCFWRGQTRVEYLLDIHAYQLGLLGNLRQGLGTRWYLIWLSPFISSPLESNGQSYKTREMEKFSHSAKSL